MTRERKKSWRGEEEAKERTGGAKVIFIGIF
jgi:hypothetical protein